MLVNLELIKKLNEKMGSDCDIVPLNNLSDSELSWLRENSYRTCSCCGGEAWHHQIVDMIGDIVIMRHIKCGDCDLAGMQMYLSYN